MAVSFILGRAGSGKTHYCVQAIVRALAEPGGPPLLLLVPEQASLQMERTLAARSPTGGYSRAEVLSFSRLTRRVLDATDASLSVIDARTRRAALRAVLARIDGGLPAFGPAAARPGFVRELDRIISELLREGITPAALRQAADAAGAARTRERARQLADVLEAYESWLGPQRIDPSAQLAALRNCVERAAWLRGSALWVDGFAGFTGQELATLASLARLTAEMHVTLLLDPDSPTLDHTAGDDNPLALFSRTEITCRHLRRLFAEAGVPLAPSILLNEPRMPRFAECEPLTRLERGLALPQTGASRRHAATPPASPDETPAVRVLRCNTHRDEAAQAARFIRQQVIDSAGRLHFRDFALIVRELEPLAEMIADVFDTYEVPYFIDRRRPLAHHALTRFIRALFDALRDSLSVRSMSRLLQTGLTQLERGHCERIVELLEEHNLRGPETWTRSRWDFRAASGARPESPPEAEARRAVGRAIQPLLLLAGAGDAPLGKTWAAAIHETLAALRVPTQIERWMNADTAAGQAESAEVHRQAWTQLARLLDDLHDVLGDTPLRLTDVAGVIVDSLADATLGIAPPTVDQVLVSSIERSRHPDIRHAWILGFNEGLFPAPPSQPGLLSTAEREELQAAGLTLLSSPRDEAFVERLFAYIALTRPSAGLTISFAAQNDAGDELFPSPLLNDVQAALPEVPIERPETDPPPICAWELASGSLAARGREPPSPLAATYQQLEARLRDSDVGRRVEWLLRGRSYTNELAPIGNFRRPADADAVWLGSASELECYVRCPFQHFAQHGLRFSTYRGPKPLEMELGSNAHAALAHVTQAAIDSGRDAAEIPDDQWLAWLEAAAEKVRSDDPPELPARRPEFYSLRENLFVQLRELVLAHAARWRRSRFRPLWVERGFGRQRGDDDLPPLALDTPGGQRIALRGSFDRVDAWESAGCRWLLVYDYKSTGKPLKGRYLTGDALQMFVYLLALREIRPGEDKDRLAGALIAPLYPNARALDPGYAASADEPAQRMYLHRPRGLVAESVAEAIDTQVSEIQSPVAGLRRTRDGGFDSRGDLAAPEAIGGRIDLARETLQQAAHGILAGNIAVQPLLERRKLACAECSFRQVCRFELIYNTPRRAERDLPRIDDARADSEADE